MYNSLVKLTSPNLKFLQQHYRHKHLKEAANHLLLASESLNGAPKRYLSKIAKYILSIEEKTISK